MRLLIFSFSILFSFSVFGQVDLRKGLRLFYPISGKVADSSGNNNNPKKNNTKLTADRFGNPEGACHFNGKNSYMYVADDRSLDMEDEISICVWIRPTGFYKDRCHVNSILHKGNEHSVNTYSCAMMIIYTGMTVIVMRSLIVT